MARVLRSVNNALAVLESFSAERPEIGVTELSHTLGLGKSTVHRLLTSLAARGYVRKNPDTERYRLGFKAFEVGSLVAGRGAVREVAAPFLRSLMRATKETVHLGVLDEWEVVYIDKMESDQPLQMYSRIGRRAPLHCTALGKALVAGEPEDWLDRFLGRRLRGYTALDSDRARRGSSRAREDPGAPLRARRRRVRAGAQVPRGAAVRSLPAHSRLDRHRRSRLPAVQRPSAASRFPRSRVGGRRLQSSGRRPGPLRGARTVLY
jgi:DNA-binding IclR family transcriptional regulator